MPTLAVTDVWFHTISGSADCRHEMFGQEDGSVDTADSFGQDQEHPTGGPGDEGRVVEEAHQTPGGDQGDLFLQAPAVIGVGAGERVGRHGEKGETAGNPGISPEGAVEVVGEHRAVDHPAERAVHVHHRTRAALDVDAFGHRCCIDEMPTDLEPPAGSEGSTGSSEPAQPADGAERPVGGWEGRQVVFGHRSGHGASATGEAVGLAGEGEESQNGTELRGGVGRHPRVTR